MNALIQKIGDQAKRLAVLVPGVFFALLFCGLLLGDGKQGVIEVFSGSIVFVCWGIFYMKSGLYRRLPSFISTSWIFFSLVAFGSMMGSDSIGFSLSWFVRYFSSFALYLLFYSLASKTTAKVFVIGTCLLAMGSVGLSLLSAIFPLIRELLPSMNLVDVRYGHSHLADLLVLVCPAAFYWMHTPVVESYKKILVGALYIMVLFFTFARGAWLIVILYGLFYVIAVHTHHKKQSIFLITLSLFVFMGGIAGASRFPSVSQNISRQLTRSATVLSRLEYWRQAAEAFKERPFLGSGPGTFSLESQRFQRAVGRSSWFAHSIFMQTLAEMGLVGFVAFLWLIYVNFVSAVRVVRTDNDCYFTVLAHGCTLLFAYGLFEFVLDYQIMWLLFWAGTGLLTGIASIGVEHHNKNKEPLFVVALGYIVVFYFLWICSAVAFVLGVRASIVYYLAPYDAGNALMALTKTKNATTLLGVSNVAQVFHAKNPQIMIEVSKAQRLLNNYSAGRQTIRVLAQSYPILEEVQREYVLLLVADKDYEGIARWVQAVSPGLFYSNARYSNQDTTLSKESIEYVANRLPALFKKSVAPNVRYSRFFYAVGLYYLTRDAEKTRRLWRLSSDLQPGLSYLWAERASLEQYVFMDIATSDDILRTCQTNETSRGHCLWLVRTQKLPKPGGFEKNIYEE